MWVSIPKVASMSIAAALAGREVAFTFAFIRHPWARLLSALNHNFAPDGVTLEERYAANAHDYHLRSQTEILAPLMHRVEFLGRYERLLEDWGHVRRQIGVGPLPHLNRGPEDDWRRHEWSWALPRYAQDFELCRDWSTS